MYGPHGGKKLANVLKGTYWVNNLSNKKWTEKFSKGCCWWCGHHSSLCMRMIHVSGEMNMKKLICVLCFEWAVVNYVYEKWIYVIVCQKII